MATKPKKKAAGPRRKLPISVAEIDESLDQLTKAIDEIGRQRKNLESMGVSQIDIDGVGMPKRAWKLLRTFIRKVEKEIDDLA